MKKGFTLMEILAVLLLIAVVLTLAVPVLRVVRQDMRNLQARAAAQKLAEAIHTFYVETHGVSVTKNTCFTPTLPSDLANIVNAAPTSCENVGAVGKPADSNTHAPFSQLFACGYLEAKDFISLPYEFCNYHKYTTSCTLPEVTATVVAYGTEDAGAKYAQSKGCIYVDSRRRAMDTYD